MTEINSKDVKWLKECLQLHARLAPAVQSLLKNMVEKEKIEHLSVTYRVKDADGASEKIQRKNYDNPREQLTDLSGIRVITFLEDHVNQVSDLVRQLFEIDEKNSLDRATILGHDRIGYRSTHFVCKLGKNRETLPEYKSLGDLKFEIQIRTVLQHAWAELAHDRSFKFGSVLPTKIQRKLNLYSGMLEVVDEGFKEISKEIDAYRTALQTQTIQHIADLEIDSLSLLRFVEEIGEKFEIVFLDHEIPNSVVADLVAVGIKTIGQLEKIATSDAVLLYKKHAREFGAGTFLRSIVALHNFEKFLKAVTVPFVNQRAFRFFAEKYGEKKLRSLLAKHDVPIVP